VSGSVEPGRPTHPRALSPAAVMMVRMATRIQITIDGHDTGRLADFWTTALHYERQPPPDGSPSWTDYWRSRGLPEEDLAEIEAEGYDKIADPDGVGPGIWFQPVPESKTVKNRVHLDLDVTPKDQPLLERIPVVDAEVARLVAAGASILSTNAEPGVDHYGVVMADPEGNEFCVS
jgi:hypothetical protein